VVVSCQVSRLTQVLAAAKEGAELAIIDTPGKSTDALIAAAKAADFVLMPIQPQLYDIETLESLKDILTLAGNPPAAVVVNRAPIQGRRHLETQEAASAKGFKVCPVVIYARAAHGDAGNIGQTAAEYDPAGKAALEMKELYAYSIRALKEDRRREEKPIGRRA
jgi:chromosome partitioning protein